MDWFNNTKRLIVDITSNCGLMCAQCTRNEYGNKLIDGLKLHDMDMELWKQIVDRDIASMDIIDITFTGRWGDPCAHPQLPEMLDYLAKKHSDKVVTIVTSCNNGDSDYYQSLGKSMQQFYYHNLDVGYYGLEKTHNQFRLKGSFKVARENAKSFIDTGGNARWLMTYFDNNKSEIDKSRKAAHQDGYTEFKARAMSVYETLVVPPKGKQYSLFSSNWETPGKLQEDEQWGDDSAMIDIHKRISAAQTNSPCEAISKNSVTIDPWGFVWPCNHIEKFTFDSRLEGIIVDDAWDDYGDDFNNLQYNSMQDILMHTWFADDQRQAVETGCWTICKEECGCGTV
jgi:MoaA/NifB/PqqE/SkfB family radical SAM enzyme